MKGTTETTRAWAYTHLPSEPRQIGHLRSKKARTEQRLLYLHPAVRRRLMDPKTTLYRDDWNVFMHLVVEVSEQMGVALNFMDEDEGEETET